MQCKHKSAEAGLVSFATLHLEVVLEVPSQLGKLFLQPLNFAVFVADLILQTMHLLLHALLCVIQVDGILMGGHVQACCCCCKAHLLPC